MREFLLVAAGGALGAIASAACNAIANFFIQRMRNDIDLKKIAVELAIEDFRQAKDAALRAADNKSPAKVYPLAVWVQNEYISLSGMKKILSLKEKDIKAFWNELDNASELITAHLDNPEEQKT